MSTCIKVGTVAIALWLCSLLAHAETAVEKMRAAERTADAELASRERTCNAKFVVASCVEQAQRDHRIKISALRSEAAALDEARRRSLADTRRQLIADKLSARQSEAQRSSSGASESERQSTQRVRSGPRKLDMSPLGPTSRFPSKRMPHKTVPKPSRPLLPGRAASTPKSAAEREAVARRQREKFETRNRDIEAHRADTLRRQADREAHGRVAAPLPLPQGAVLPPQNTPP